MSRLPLFFITLFLFAACNNKPPEGVLEEQKMVDVLTDLTVIDGYMSILMYTDTPRIQGKNFYATVYKKHQISKADFDKSLKYYSSQPVLLDSMYSKVNKKLDLKEKKLMNIGNKKQIRKRLTE